MQAIRNLAHALTSVFGCRHDRLTRPFTIQQQSYMVCLECGQKVFYSMDEMRRLSRREIRRMYAAQAGILCLTPKTSEPATAMADDPTLAA